MSDPSPGSPGSVLAQSARRALFVAVGIFLLMTVAIPYGFVPLAWKGYGVTARLQGRWYSFQSPLAFVRADSPSVRALPIYYGLVGFLEGPPDGVALGGCGGGWSSPRYLILVGSPWWPYPSEGTGRDSSGP